MAEVILARYRNTDYIVRCEIDGNKKEYRWKGSRGDKFDKKKVPQEVVDWLNLNTNCFKVGALAIVGKEEEIKEIKKEIIDVESYENNTHSYEEIKNILLGNYKRMEAQLSKITVDDEKRFVLQVAKEVKDDLTGGKQNFIAKWAGQDVSVLFE